MTDFGQADAGPNVSFVVIGYNEGARLEACLRSVREADLEGLRTETIYVDGGSSDDSLAVARRAGADMCLGGERRRRAAENRNLGLAHASGRLVQFLDGDMTLERSWVRAGLEAIEAHPGAAVVWGRMREVNPNVFYRALQLDWEFPEGPSLYCGGAAMYRREPLVELGGFPEDTAFGEEPYLCWRIRNELGMQVIHLHQAMVGHDLGYRGLLDYTRRNVRCGETFAEVASRCRCTAEPLWRREVRSHLAWGAGILAVLALLLAGPWAARAGVALLMAAVLARKTMEWRWRGNGLGVSFLYALHTYSSKVSIAFGIVRWRLRHMFRRKK
ncbi:MAG TPA: glycosyltransferase family A protein [Candidatus Hydrogenedentes bacterium]|nr:glycosyltransferase family A protein [Candidatus Hydrogenedentota bacterium]HNT87167.1 glycosyltransferase family A protein [Candidatus Hydrogenedentota bacterium]